jgi:hypothetical protein
MSSKTKTVSLADLRRAAPDQVTVWNDTDCWCYRADPIDGYTIDGLHGFCHPYGNLAGGVTRAEAKADLLDRLADVDIERCAEGNSN